MNAALWGLFSALSFGTADFIARFTSRGLGPQRSLFGILIISAVLLTAYVAATGLPPSLAGGGSRLWLIAAHGIALTASMLLLYWGLARGPVNVVASLVATHPALIVGWALLLGARLGALQWAAMAAALLGAIAVAWSAEQRSSDRAALNKTILIALATSLAYAANLLLAQAAVPLFGSLATLWLGRLVALAALLPLFALQRRSPLSPLSWWPLLLVQGGLDAGGMLCLLLGSGGDDSAIAAVVASGFGAVTVLLARLFLKEPMSWLQWLGVALVFSGGAVLAGMGG
jgi:drug/metabolite transporter (DMT)-like permease